MVSLKKAGIFLFIGFFFFINNHLIDGPDIYTPIIDGRLMIQQGTPDIKVPTFLSEENAVNYRWLFEYSFFKIHETFGNQGLIILQNAVYMLLFLTIFYFINSMTGNFGISIFYAVFPVLSYMLFCGELRPQLVSLFLFSLVFVIFKQVSAKRLNKKLLFFIPLVIAVWANIHVTFLIGLLLIFFEAFTHPEDKKFALLLVLSGAASFLTPHGYMAYLPVFDYLKSRPIYGTISELQPLIKSFPMFVIFVLVTALNLVTISKTGISDKESLPEFFLVIIFFFKTIFCMKFLIYYVLVSSFIAGSSGRKNFEKKSYSVILFFLCVVALGLIAGPASPVRKSYLDSESLTDIFDFHEKSGVKGVIYTPDVAVNNYVSYRFYPDIIPLVNGLTNAHSDEAYSLWDRWDRSEKAFKSISECNICLYKWKDYKKNYRQLSFSNWWIWYYNEEWLLCGREKLSPDNPRVSQIGYYDQALNRGVPGL
ncbi:hypothetical protein FP828_09010 [bacterium]|nr:hypothetical protein [bacterium]